jgi:hypothetical protein
MYNQPVVLHIFPSTGKLEYHPNTVLVNHKSEKGRKIDKMTSENEELHNNLSSFVMTLI